MKTQYEIELLDDLTKFTHSLHDTAWRLGIELGTGHGKEFGVFELLEFGVREDIKRNKRAPEREFPAIVRENGFGIWR